VASIKDSCTLGTVLLDSGTRGGNDRRVCADLEQLGKLGSIKAEDDSSAGE